MGIYFFYQKLVYRFLATAAMCITFSILTITAATGQESTGTLRGTVIDSSGAPVSYIPVALKNTETGQYTDKAGRFEIKVPAGEYILVVEALGFRTYQEEVLVESGEITTLQNIVLQTDPNQLDEIVFSENEYNADEPSQSLRIDAPLVEIPQNIQVVTEEAIEDQQSIDMLETVSRNVSGAQMIEHWGTFARVNMRGFKIPAFRNGFNVEIPWGPLSEDMSIVERIEFVKGPAGFLLSSGEPGGLYNVVTKKPSLYHRNEVSLTAGSFNTLRATADIGGKIDKEGDLLYRVNLMGLTKGSHRDYEFNNRYTIAPSLKYKLSERTSVTAEYIYQYSQMSVIGAAYVFSANEFGELPRDFTFTEPNIDPSVIREHNIFLTMNHEFNKNWELTARAGYLNYNQEGSSIWIDSISPSGYTERALDIFDAFNESKLGQVFLNGNLSTGPVKHNILTGIDAGQKDYFADWFQTRSLGGPFNIYDPKYGVPADSIPAFDREESVRKRATSGGYPAISGQRYSSFYAQDRLEFFNNRIRLTLAGRYTYYNGWSYGNTTEDQVITPRLGLSATVIENTSVYALYDQGFIPVSGATIENEPFEPVRANNLEAGIKREWADGKWNTTLAFYQITKENIVTAHPDRINYPNAQVQLGEVRSRGFEFDAQGEIVDGLHVILNYANTNVVITEDTDEEVVGDRVAGHARHITNGWLSYRFDNNFLENFSLSVGYQYQVDRSSWNWTSENEAELPDYFRLDGAIRWQSDNLSIGLNVNNILNDYLYSGANYGSYLYWQTEPGINYRLTMRYRFD